MPSREFFSSLLAEFLSRPVTAKLSLLIGGSVAYAALVLFAVYVYTSKREREFLAREQKLLVKDQEIEVLNSQLRDRDRLRLLDIVTGIPNQLKWERDVENLSKTDDPAPHYQMIIIDLDNFRDINRAYGYEKGDRVSAPGKAGAIQPVEVRPK